MHRNIISLTSVLSLFIGLTSYASIIQAHEDDKQCNVLLDGDGEPVKESDSDSIDHANSHACASGDEAKNDAYGSGETTAEVIKKQVEKVTVAAVTVDPIIVYFDSGSDELSAGANAEVQAFAEQLVATNPKGVTVVGYTDTSGSAALNEKLSKTRASNVVASLVDAGLLSDIIEQGAVGEETLAVATPDGTGEPNNRRVVVTPQY